MCYFGAGLNTDTSTQLKQLLNLHTFNNNTEILNITGEFLKNINSNSWAKDGITMNSANKIFPSVEFDIRASYRRILSVTFNTTEQALNFSNSATLAANAINSWVAANTNNKINNLIDEKSLTKETRLVLVNTLYFKGSWQMTFDGDAQQEEFNLTNGRTARVTMMQFRSAKMLRVQNQPNGLQARTCEMLFNGSRLAMTIILPDRSLQEVERNLSAATLNVILGQQNLSLNNTRLKVIKMNRFFKKLTLF
jgi:serine protease inhibitor